MSCQKTFLYTCMRKMVKISCAVIVQLIIANIFDPYSGLQIRVCFGKLFYISHLNQAGVPCSLTNSTGKFDFNPKHVAGTQKNRLNETVLLSTQNIC